MHTNPDERIPSFIFKQTCELLIIFETFILSYCFQPPDYVTLAQCCQA